MEQSPPYETGVNILHPTSPVSIQRDFTLLANIHNMQSTPCDIHDLSDTGHRVLGQYCRTQNSGDLDQSIVYFESSLDLCPIGHPCRPAALVNLAIAKLISCQVNGTYLDLGVPISLFQDALDLRPTGHPDRSATQLHLAIAFLSRFAKRGFQTDADVAEELLIEVLDVCHMKSYVYRSALITIETSILHQPCNIGANDLRVDEPITSMFPLSVNQLARRVGLCLQNDDPHALDEAISLHYEALKYYSTAHSSRMTLLSNLSAALRTRFERRSNDKDLDDAIVLATEGLNLSPAGHLNRPMLLNNLGNALSDRFHWRSNYKDLDEAIVVYREALPLWQADQRQGALLNNIANALYHRFRIQGHHTDIDEAIVLYRDALTLLPVGHPNRYISLSGLAVMLSHRFEHGGNDQDVDELDRDDLISSPIGCSNRSMSSSNTVNEPVHSFEKRSNKDLDEAIALFEEVLPSRPVGHPLRPMLLHNMANTLHVRFNDRGNDNDLDDAIMLHREALALQPVGHTDRHALLNSIANALSRRFCHRGNHKDRDEAIVLRREALVLLPLDHEARVTLLANLANDLVGRSQDRDNQGELDEGIALHWETLPLRPVGHRYMSLHNIASALLYRFERQGRHEDLDEAITLCKEALTLLPVNHLDYPALLCSVADLLSKRFKYRGKQEDLDDGLANARSALTLLKAHNPEFKTVNVILADIHLSLHQSGLNNTANDTDDLNTSLHHIKAAANSVRGGLLSRLNTSLQWVDVASQYTHSTLLEAYTTSIQLLDAYISATSSISSRYHTAKTFPATLAVEAASAALQCGDVCRAVELLEQGRTLIWTQMARFRTPLDTLEERDSHAEALVKRFRELSAILNKHDAEPAGGIPRVKEEAEAVRYSRLVDEWNSVVEEIRKLEGFSRFMLPPLFSDLQRATCDGPVIILIASKLSCDAIIVASQHSPISVPLGTSLENLLRLVTALRRTVKRETDPGENQAKLIEVLRELWADVVCPVVKNLARLAQPGSRIWWCPTLFFSFLPLHAAGEYRRGGMNLSKLYISSYTPSLTALTRTRRNRDKSQATLFAAIGQNHPAGHTFTLQSVEPELELVRSLLPPYPTVCFTKVTSIESTKSKALRTLQANHWLHFACHGTQKLAEPFNSAFLMRDEPLTLLEITQTDLCKHEFAFLSACETALGVLDRPDEVIHLAAALQFAGVKSVIGTFWSVEDATVGRLVQEFYRNFCGDGKMNSKRAARALHKAVQSLANDEDIPLDQRIVFMHIGI